MYINRYADLSTSLSPDFGDKCIDFKVIQSNNNAYMLQKGKKMKCETCDGKRIIYGFGGIKQKCTACNGSGAVVLSVKTHNIDKRTKQFRDDKKEG